MPKTTVSLRGLRTFCVAARDESFSKAAERLFVTPSAVSHQIKRLEDELGQTLFDRNARELRLTGVGQSLYAEVDPLIERLDAIAGAYRRGAVRSAVRMSVQPFFASEYFVPRLGEFTGKHPEIDIQVSASDESSESHPADADLSIRLFRAPPDDVESVLLFPLTLVPAGSAALADSLVQRDGSIVSEFPIVVHDSYPRAWKQWSGRSGIRLPKKTKVTHLDSMIAAVRAAEQGIGAALVPVPMANQWFEQGTIVRLFDDELVADVSYYLTWRKSVAGRQPVELLKSWILKRFSST